MQSRRERSKALLVSSPTPLQGGILQEHHIYAYVITKQYVLFLYMDNSIQTHPLLHQSVVLLDRLGLPNSEHRSQMQCKGIIAKKNYSWQLFAAQKAITYYTWIDVLKLQSSIQYIVLFSIILH